MIRSFLRRILAVTAMAFFASATMAHASLVPIPEGELNGTATNNTRDDALVIPGSEFTTPPPPGVFNPPPGYFTATIIGAGGSSDVDFYSFNALGGTAFFDIDNIPFTFDTILSLFDSNGTLLAYDDDSPGGLTEGSASGLDSFLGVVMLPGPGTYYIAVSTFANFPNGLDSLIFPDDFTQLTRPDTAFGGWRVAGTPFGDSSFDASDVQGLDSLPYTLHISLEQPGEVVVPEPASLTLWGLAALGCAIGAYRRRK